MYCVHACQAWEQPSFICSSFLSFLLKRYAFCSFPKNSLWPVYAVLWSTLSMVSVHYYTWALSMFLLHMSFDGLFKLSFGPSVSVWAVLQMYLLPDQLIVIAVSGQGHRWSGLYPQAGFPAQFWTSLVTTDLLCEHWAVSNTH